MQEPELSFITACDCDSSGSSSQQCDSNGGIGADWWRGSELKAMSPKGHQELTNMLNDSETEVAWPLQFIW